MGPTAFASPPREVMLRIFITLKNPSSSAGFEPANLGSSGKHVSTNPPRAIINKDVTCYFKVIYFKHIYPEVAKIKKNLLQRYAWEW
jgi:hypothetical protein